LKVYSPEPTPERSILLLDQSLRYFYRMSAYSLINYSIKNNLLENKIISTERQQKLVVEPGMRCCADSLSFALSVDSSLSSQLHSIVWLRELRIRSLRLMFITDTTALVLVLVFVIPELRFYKFCDHNNLRRI
jgi:hypothetical protein